LLYGIFNARESARSASPPIQLTRFTTNPTTTYPWRRLLAPLYGDEATCERELREAHRLFLEIGAPIRAAEVAKELGLATAS
jgi:hypothetical protein